MTKKRDPFLIISIAVLLCVFRIMVKDSQYLNEIMALINLIALFYSIWTMFNDAENILKEKIKKNTMGDEVFRNNLKKFKTFRIIIEVVVFIGLGVLYMIGIRRFNNTDGNDILTIIALCFALETGNFSNQIARFYLKR